MNLLRKYLLNSAAVLDPPDRPGRTRVSAAVQDEPYEPDAVGDDTADVDAADDDAADGDIVDDAGDPDETDDTEDESEPERRPRARQRIESLSTRNRELQAKVDASEARLAALEARLNAPAPQKQEDAREEEARLALMSAEERLNYRFEKSIAQNNRATADMLFNVQDQTDRTSFRALLREKPHFKQHEAEVEKRLRELKVKIPREAVLIYVIGESAYKSGEKPRKRSQSQERLQQQETRPGASGRGDVRGDRRQANGGISSVERRLANVRI